MKSSPLFSILICTVGKKEMVEGAIQSVLKQNFADVEIIVTDTSGTDIIRRLVESLDDNRIHFFEVPNLDPTIGWEFAYTKSTGQYVLWYDDDNRLIPNSLERYAEIIAKEKADIVSANHVYYFGEGNRHKPAQNNALVFLLPFSSKINVYDKDTLLSTVYDFSMGTSKMPARWHSAATFVSRSICEKARAEIGYVIAPHMYGNFTFHPVIFTYAVKPIYYDRPLCVIGKFSSSITQQWSNVFVNEKRNSAVPYQFTGVSERTLGNTTAECYLRVRHDIQKHEIYPFNWEKFYHRYIDELLMLNIPFRRHLKAWHEVWITVDKLESNACLILHRQILRRSLQSVFLDTLRQIKLLEIARKLIRKPAENVNRKTISLSPHGIYSIETCAQRLDEILGKELGNDYFFEKGATNANTRLKA